ncbi:MAG: 3-methyl-2-oxobutanoate hydroxymethyltransferase [Legionellaceae bacterium]|nr:3-methyl-2-oxobutanoate hydroxymethyltransferase [Legionellaceae bacterium]
MKLHDFLKKKINNNKISMLTCYDYPSACIVSESNIDCVLVGDSVAMTVHGHKSTIMATMDMMVLHTEAVARGIGKKFVVSDLPFLSYRESTEKTIQNVQLLMQAGAQAVKIEGGDESLCKTISHLVSSGIPVMGHIGLTPQTVLQLGGYKVQGRDQAQADNLLQQAKNLEKAGCFALVIECVPGDLASKISKSLTIPTIGIGAGVDTDGQVLVWHDILGIQSEINFSFVKRFSETKPAFLDAINLYASEVMQKTFPEIAHTF